MAYITDRQQDFIITLYKRVDEIHLLASKLDMHDPQRLKYSGAADELLRLSDRLKLQWLQEAELLESVKQQITDEPIPSITPEEEYAINA
tara:strand:+ start:5575 stop:5844 length:270 start_codon:yes stop_codon:yes gene_type:complete